MTKTGRRLGIYIHIPFCKAKCLYCDFNSFPCRDDFIPAYFNALKREIALYAERLKGYSIETVFIGGGTPSFVDAHNIYEIIEFMKNTFEMENCYEITIETNPGTLSFDKLMAYRTVGINRISIGLQAWQNRLLSQLGRIHTVEEFIENYNFAQKAGFDNINVDLIFGIPGQTFCDWMETLEYTASLKPAHLSCYSLIIEEGTVYGTRLKKGELVPVDDEVDRKMYWHTIDKLGSLGYEHYEISNFAKEGFKCAHNMIYWKEREYIGFGAGAHSYFKGQRFNNVYDIEEYIGILNRGCSPVENPLHITKEDEMSEFVMLGLRLIEGVRVKEFGEMFDRDIFEVFRRQIESLLQRGLIEVSNGFIKLTKLGLDLANQVFVEFV
ncbi:MAG: oxygen-independent coproporphyrinogen III oxidase [Clostridium sp.]|nr:oxygen-independent coproporphyrinogen III oxidase [Clostridium sp.]